MKILFLCRENCRVSKLAYKHLLKFKGTLVTKIESDERGKAILSDKLFPVDYILCFRYPKILAEHNLSQGYVMEGAINFHPAPPRYRGSGAINHALYNGDKSFGVTAHLMNKGIDSGHIVGLREWPIDPTYDVSTLLKVAEAELLELFKEITTELYHEYNQSLEDQAEVGDKLFERQTRYRVQKVFFEGSPHYIEEINKMSHIDPNIDEKELRKIIHATWIPDSKHNPYINVHGYKFVLKSDRPE